MAIKRPDIYEHNNPNYAIVDSDFVRGSFRTPVADLTDLYALSGKTDQLKEHSTIVYVTGETKYYILVDINNIDNVSGWNEFQTGSGSGTITGGTNGLSTSGANIVLGGNLLSGTTINGDNNNLSIININDFQVKTSGDTIIFGLDKEGFLLQTTGGSVTFDDGGGLKYGADYSSGYTTQSIPDVNFVTGLTNTYLKLDQSTSQNVIGSQPIFDEGIRLGTTPSTSQISGHTIGRIYYDNDYKTISLDIGDETTLQVGQESMRYVYNATGSEIKNGSIVYVNGVHSGSGTDTVTIELAIASGTTTSEVLGMATQNIPNNGFGFVTTYGNVNNLDTVSTSSPYSGMTVGDKIYLSASVYGGVTNVPPTSPDIEVHIGRLISKDSSNGKVFVSIHPALSLNDLTDVAVPTPSVDNVLKFNGVTWIDAPISTSSASAGVSFYASTPYIQTRTAPVGLTADGTAGNGIEIISMSKIPVVTGGTQYISGITNAGQTRTIAASEYPFALGKSLIDAGTWLFYSYARVDSVGGGSITTATRQIYLVTPISGGTLTTTGSGTNNRTATITSNQFTGLYFTGTTDNTTASWLRTSSGIYQISGVSDNNNVDIIVPTGYSNETAITGATIWKKLFAAPTTPALTTDLTLYDASTTQSAFVIEPTDRLGAISFITTDTTSRTVIGAFNGTTYASYFNSPLVTTHNDLAGLQGGINNERYHITLSELNNLNNQSGINTGDETKSTIESKLTGEIFTHYHPYSGLTGKPDLTQYQSVSGFTGYTANTQPILDNAITGATNVGTGTPVYSGNSDNNLQFNTIVGSGGTTVQKVGNEIVINTPTVSGSQLYSGDTPSAVDLCGITIGYELTGKTISCILQDLLVPELCGSITAPTTSISLSCSGIVEIGNSFSQTVTANFDRGCINPQYCSISDKRSGLPNAYSFTGSGMPVPIQLCTNLTASENIASYSVVSGVQTWGVCTRYDAGQPALGSKGTEYCAALTSGYTIQDTASINGILPWYWGTKANNTITGSDVANGTKTVAIVGQSTPICFDATTEYLWFAAPAGTTTKTKWWVCAANAGNIGGTGELWAAPCSVAVTSAEGCWSGCNFDVYVTCGITTTDTGIPMCLYY